MTQKVEPLEHSLLVVFVIFCMSNVPLLVICVVAVIQVSDCARHPAFIDEDSAWFHQDCFDCEEGNPIGKVGATDGDDRNGETERAEREREMETCGCI